MKTIYLIGAGQIGSRHLQALKLVKQKLNILVIDKSDKSLSVARERYGMVKGANHEIKYLNEIPEKGMADLVIIATTSNVRMKILEELVSKIKVKYLILEKLLFDKKKDYEKAFELIKKYKIKVWVNCPTRMWAMYKNVIQEKLKNEKIILTLDAYKGFGLASNSIHHIDLITHLTGSGEYIVDTSLLEPKPYKSKRKGFVDFDGTLQMKFRNGSLLILNASIKDGAPIILTIMSDKMRVIFNETSGESLIADLKGKWKFKKLKTSVNYQSKLTNLAVNEIFKTGKSILPTLEESTNLHLPVLEALIKHLNKNSKKKYNYYPFT